MRSFRELFEKQAEMRERTVKPFAPKSDAARIRYRESIGIKNPTAETKTGPCEICGKVVYLRYDHDHETGLFRGWLCMTCNAKLGWLEKWFPQIRDYLNKGGSKWQN